MSAVRIKIRLSPDPVVWVKFFVIDPTQVFEMLVETESGSMVEDDEPPPEAPVEPLNKLPLLS